LKEMPLDSTPFPACLQPHDAVELLRGMVPIRSTTTAEANYIDHLSALLSHLGYTVERQSVVPGRDNILAYRGARENIRVLFNAHTDTVPPHMDLREDTENIYGRGSCDAKGSTAAQIVAAERLHARVPPGSIGLLYVVGEEVDHAGMIAANRLGLKPSYVIVGEPTENKLAVGHKGVLRCRLVAHGRAAHSGYPQYGQSAILRLIDAIQRLEAIKFPDDPQLGPTTLNTGQIGGGRAANVVPDEAWAYVMVRVSTTVDQVWSLMEQAVHGLEGVEAIREAAYERVVCHTVPGFETAVEAFFTDIPQLKGDHKSCLLGPGSILVAHSEREFISKSELVEAVGLYERLVIALLEK